MYTHVLGYDVSYIYIYIYMYMYVYIYIYIYIYIMTYFLTRLAASRAPVLEIAILLFKQ